MKEFAQEGPARGLEDVAVIGAGIVGLAHAWSAARRGHSVVVFERARAASGASIRNFGMIWPIGQLAGEMHSLALRSREIWLNALHAAKLSYRPTGSLHVAHRADEADVLREFAEVGPAAGYQCEWLSSEATLRKSDAIQPAELAGSLWSGKELTVDPREVIAELPKYLDEAGVTRLPALDGRGIAAGTVAATSARICDARSTYEDGILTRVNQRAAALGIGPGMTAREFVQIVRRTAAEPGRNA